MCNRESFILLPEETGIPVNWGLTYHHQEILQKLPSEIQNWERNGLKVMGASLVCPIECIGGDIYKWDWQDNAPKIYLDEYGKVGEGICCYDYDPTPIWMRNKLGSYRNTVYMILGQLNYLRDSWEHILSILLNYREYHPEHRSPKFGSLVTFDTINMIKNGFGYHYSDSPEVREFNRIIQEYEKIPGYVGNAYKNYVSQNETSYYRDASKEKVLGFSKMKKKTNHDVDTSHMMSDEEFVIFENDRLEELPTDILNKAIEVLKKEITEITKEKIREDFSENPIYWFAPFHFGWGMSIRNLLREKVCSDDKLPSGNWDDYYVQIIEIVVHARMYS